MSAQESVIAMIDGLADDASPCNAYEKLCGYFRLEDIFTTDSVAICVLRCASGQMHKKDTQAFLTNLTLNSYLLCQKVLDENFVPKYYRKTKIHERGKERIIQPPIFECKVVQKVLCDYVIRPLLTPKMIETNYAGITGRGTDKMFDDISKALDKAATQTPNGYIVRTDFRSYFPSIDTKLLREMFEKYIQDKKVVNLIMSFSLDEYGLSLGNEISQVPASFFPSSIDHFAKDIFGIPFFRYMDDSLAILSSWEDVEDYLFEFETRAERLHLCLPKEKIKVTKIGEDFSFCKEKFRFDKEHGYYYRNANPNKYKIQRHKLRKFREKKAEGTLNIRETANQTKSVIGSLAKHPHSKKMVAELTQMAEEIGLLKP